MVCLQECLHPTFSETCEYLHFSSQTFNYNLLQTCFIACNLICLHKSCLYIITHFDWLRYQKWKVAAVVLVQTLISVSCWHLSPSLRIRSCQWALLLHTPPHTLRTVQQLLKSLVLRALCMIVTGRAWGLISAVSPSKALAVYSGLQRGRQGLSLPRHHASLSSFSSLPHPPLPHGSHCSGTGSSSGLHVSKPG